WLKTAKAPRPRAASVEEPARATPGISSIANSTTAATRFIVVPPCRPRPAVARRIASGGLDVTATALFSGRILHAMERRRLGQTDMVVSVLGFGGSEIGYDGVAPRTVARLLNSGLDAGLNVVDTAECYVDSESLIGQAVGARRREFYLFTKCGHPRGWAR